MTLAQELEGRASRRGGAIARLFSRDAGAPVVRLRGRWTRWPRLVAHFRSAVADTRVLQIGLHELTSHHFAVVAAQARPDEAATNLPRYELHALRTPLGRGAHQHDHLLAAFNDQARAEEALHAVQAALLPRRRRLAVGLAVVLGLVLLAPLPKGTTSQRAIYGSGAPGGPYGQIVPSGPSLGTSPPLMGAAGGLGLPSRAGQGGAMPGLPGVGAMTNTPPAVAAPGAPNAQNVPAAIAASPATGGPGGAAAASALSGDDPFGLKLTPTP